MLALVEADSETATLIKTLDICRVLQPQVASAHQQIRLRITSAHERL